MSRFPIHTRAVAARATHARRGAIRAVCAACALFAASAMLPPSAFASADGTWPVSSAEVLLGHDALYSLAGVQRTHSGADIAAEAGEAVASAVSGEVSFVGRVPAAGSETVLAVTVLAGDLKVTYLPLARACVSRGDAVDAGDDLGEIAAAGDASSGESHVHVSVRRGELYLDPLAVMAAPSGTGRAGGEVEPEPVVAGAAAASSAATAKTPTPTAAVPHAAQAPAAASSAAASAPSASRAPVPGTADPVTRAATANAAAVPTPQAVPTAASLPLQTAVGVSGVKRSGASSGPRMPQAASVSGGSALLRLGSMPAVGLRLPGLPEAALGSVAALLLRLGLGRAGRRKAQVGAPVVVPVRVSGRR